MINSDIEDLSNYKESKAYSYFKGAWLRNISYHSLGTSEDCLLKIDSSPFERLRDSPHKLWVCLSKKEWKVVIAH